MIFILSKIMMVLMSNKLKSNLEPEFIRIREGSDITNDNVCRLGLQQCRCGLEIVYIKPTKISHPLA